MMNTYRALNLRGHCQRADLLARATTPTISREMVINLAR